MAPLTRSRKLSGGGGSPCALPAGEPQTAKKETEKAAAPPSPSLEAAEEEEEEEEEESEEIDMYECYRCLQRGDVEDSDLGALCQRHANLAALEEGKRAGGRHAKWPAARPVLAAGTPEAEEQAARVAQIRRLKRRRKRAESEDEESDDEELSPQEAAAHQQARQLLRIRYVLRRGRPADVVRYLRAAVRFADGSAAAAATSLAHMLPESRWPAQPRHLDKCVRCKKRYDQAYPAVDACRLLHDFPSDTNGNLTSEFCNRCDANRATHSNDGENTSVEQSETGDDKSDEDEEGYEEEDAEDC